MGRLREDSNAYLALSGREIGYGVNHFIESVTENWRYFQFPSIFVVIQSGCRRNVYFLKIEAKSFRVRSQDIFEDTESNLGPFAGF